MNTHADKTQENKSQSFSNKISQKLSDDESAFQLVDNRPEAVAQRKLQEMANNSPQVKQAFQLKAMADNYSVLRQPPIQKKERNAPSLSPTTISPLIIGGLAMGTAIAYAIKRRAGITIALDVDPPQQNGQNLLAGVAVQATGLQSGDWVDYQIKWASGAVPGFNGEEILNAHLGQQIGVAGGWLTDRPPLGNQDPLARTPDNLRYTEQENGTANFLYIDQIQQSINMPQGNPNDRRWWFRAIVRNSWNIPIRTSNEVLIQWP